MDNLYTKAQLANMIDHTLLKPQATKADIVRLCAEAKEFGFGTVCVNPVQVAPAVLELQGTAVKVCTVIGFPLGANSTEIKAQEALLAVRQGAQEIDMVLNIGALQEGSLAVVKEDIFRVTSLVKDYNFQVLVKVIIETCLLNDEAKKIACQLTMEAGADFVKTSTGFATGGATVEDIILMRSIVGQKLGVKASGGIRDLATAISMLKAGASRLGTSSGTSIVKSLTM